jgi:tetrahydromethanopterin S-methyltransferase subunit C
MDLLDPFLDRFAALPHNVQRLVAILMIAVVGRRLATLAGRVVDRAVGKFGKNSTKAFLCSISAYLLLMGCFCAMLDAVSGDAVFANILFAIIAIGVVALAFKGWIRQRKQTAAASPRASEKRPGGE